MKLVKGASVDIQSREEECFHFAAPTPIAEISCEGEEEDRPVPLVKRGSTGRLVSTGRMARMRAISPALAHSR